MGAVTIDLDPFGICANMVCPAGVDGVGFGPIANWLVEQPGGFTVDEVGGAVERLFEPMYTAEPRQRPRLLPAAGEELDRLPEGISPVLYETLSTAGISPKPETPPSTPWR